MRAAAEAGGRCPQVHLILPEALSGSVQPAEQPGIDTRGRSTPGATTHQPGAGVGGSRAQVRPHNEAYGPRRSRLRLAWRVRCAASSTQLADDFSAQNDGSSRRRAGAPGAAQRRTGGERVTTRGRWLDSEIDGYLRGSSFRRIHDSGGTRSPPSRLRRACATRRAPRRRPQRGRRSRSRRCCAPKPRLRSVFAWLRQRRGRHRRFAARTE